MEPVRSSGTQTIGCSWVPDICHDRQGLLISNVSAGSCSLAPLHALTALIGVARASLLRSPQRRQATRYYYPRRRICLTFQIDAITHNGQIWCDPRCHGSSIAMQRDTMVWHEISSKWTYSLMKDGERHPSEPTELNVAL